MIDLSNLTIISDKEEKKQEEIKKQKKFQTFYNTINAPKRYFNARESTISHEAYTFIEENKFALLKGSIGVGKTYTACAFVNSQFFLGKTSVYFLRCYSLKSLDLNDLKELITNCKRVGTLIVDDIGFVVGNNFIVELVVDLLLSRVDDEKRTIITTNENLSELFDSRISDKLREAYKQKIITGANKRKSNL